MAISTSSLVLLCAIGIILLARPAHAFGAGNIGSTSKIEGQNWRHGDLEDTLLSIVSARAMSGKKFSKLDVKRVYFGNWLRDYSQAVDVGTVKYVSAEAIRILLWVLGFLSFGYGTGEFEVTTERLGCYRPEEHIDNPKDYADNEDARRYDRRLRGPINERLELSIDPENGMKNYIASERLGIDTSAGLVRKLLGQSIELGRQYSRNKNKDDLYEALRLLGTASHCLEDYAAHSNYVELALIELGERDVFPHVGRNTQVRLRDARQPVFPIVTGTFGGVDFLHSVCGEFDDKATQSEIQQLEGALQQAQNNRQDGSMLRDLLNKIPSGVFGGKDEVGKADELQQNAQAQQMSNVRISPRQPEEWANYLNDVQKQIYPIIQWHDEVMQSITRTVEKIPILPDLIERLQEEVNKYVFSLLAPYLIPVINQIKNELNTGSSEIIKASADKQHIVFNDDDSTDPTHSMLSKDHFSNVLNEPAGRVAQATVAWVVPQIVAAWDDKNVDVQRTLDRIVAGVLHHPALRDYGKDGASDGRRIMFSVVEEWWNEKSDREKGGLRDQLSRRGVQSGKNHKSGVTDHGHGSNKPLGIASVSSGGSDYSGGNDASSQAAEQIGKVAGDAVGGGVLGSIVSGIAGAVGVDILGGGLNDEKKTYKKDSYGQDGSHTETVSQIGYSSGGDRYGQAQYSRTSDSAGYQQREDYNRYEQSSSGDGRWQSKVHHEERTSTGGYREENRRYGDNTTSGYGQQQDVDAASRRDDNISSHGSSRRNDNTSSHGSGPRYDNASSHGSGRRDDNTSSQYGRRDDNTSSQYSRRDDNTSSQYGRRDDNTSYGRRDDNISSHGSSRRDDNTTSQGYGRRDDNTTSQGYGRRDDNTSSHGSGYDSQQASFSASDRYERQNESSSRYGRQEQSGYGSDNYGRQNESSSGYGRQEQSGYGSDNYGRQEQSGYGGYDGASDYRHQQQSSRPRRSEQDRQGYR
ncbi:hypothetical protein PV10_03372 [Exophiala mesophila]|uniref:Het-C-domain-containing protein n=1 Tax=Exophiala mesophila TaxID=212818 RepID=A0A0D1Y4Z9_EXOME|nr:uncharacterized protein PV10_03372 [Exophiala mesophila]KIV95756.1 hypothetical protein PV10_03372 [Exophiala mesophila]